MTEYHKCDYGCGRPAVHYFKTVDKWCCSKSHQACPAIKSKTKQYFMDTYGVENASQIEGVPEKAKQTWMEKYGVDNPSKLKSVQEKRINTCLDRYGVEYASQAEEVKEKAKQTCNDKYGVDYPTQIEGYDEKAKQTWMEKYGVDNPNKLEEIREKGKQTSLDRYGVEYATKSLETKEKAKQTCLDRYGVDHPNKRPEARKNSRKKALTYIQSRMKKGVQINPNYNPEGCKLIDEIGIQLGLNFQHAENGGEYHIKELGYWVDGYDKEHNVVIEIDEPHHYDSEGNLSERDVRRQQEIEEHLGCEFIRMRI